MSRKKYVIIGIIITLVAIGAVLLWMMGNRLGKGTEVIPPAMAPTVR